MPLPPTITNATVSLTWGPTGQYYGYCSVADVEYEYPDYALYSKLSTSVIAQEIASAAQELQDQLAPIYQMPYAGVDPGILQTLRQINAKLATANLLDRQQQGGDETESTAAAERRSWAELLLVDLQDGQIQWGPPFADAVPLAAKPVYPQAAGATIQPDPLSGDPYTANPVFSMSRTIYRRNTSF